ncbi:MAG: acyl carrier protein [Thermoleophilia bacterium]|nr:acyl carrier protein [Gaiellaceae bacterium]MDW8339589.1 acyl carrier protein [Thermoleophilia bacterium]
MTDDEIRDAVLRALVAVAPEADPATLRFDLELRDQLDLDSMDSLNFAVGIHEELGVDIPESEWARLQTLHEVVEYLARALSRAQEPQ